MHLTCNISGMFQSRFICLLCCYIMYKRKKSPHAWKRMWFHNAIISSPTRSNRNSRNMEKVSVISVRSRDSVLISEQAYNLSLSHLLTLQRESGLVRSEPYQCVLISFVLVRLILSFNSVKVFNTLKLISNAFFFFPIYMTLYKQSTRIIILLLVRWA